VTPNVGDVWAVRTGGIGGWIIRLGERLAGKPDLDNHVVVVHHQDPAGTVWGVEGRPGGVGWADLTKYAQNRATVTNVLQPKTNEQRIQIAQIMRQMLGTPYDWAGIAADAANDLSLPDLFAQNWHGQGTPGHVVCSSLAAWAYARVGLPHPHCGGERYCQPDDWTVWNRAEGWKS
jgi:hypothetical protein